MKNKFFAGLLAALMLLSAFQSVLLGICAADADAAAESGETVLLGSKSDFLAFAKACTLDTWSQSKTVKLTCDLDFPEDDDDYDDEDEDVSGCGCGRCYSDDEDEDDDGEPEYDGVIYDATCPVCGEEISFDEDTLAEGSIECPNCGEKLEFDLGDGDKE